MCTKIIVRIIVDFQSVEIKKRPGDGRGKIVKIATSFKSLERETKWVACSRVVQQDHMTNRTPETKDIKGKRRHSAFEENELSTKRVLCGTIFCQNETIC